MEVTALVFKGKKTAQKALDTLEDEAPEAKFWIDDVAVISRNKIGFVRVNSTWAENDDAAAVGGGFGALTGGLIGATMGPGGALAGAVAGGSLAGLTGLGVNIAVEDPRLEDFASRMADDTSALVLVADEPTTADFRSTFGSIDAAVIQTNLNEHDIKALREHLKANRKRWE